MEARFLLYRAALQSKGEEMSCAIDILYPYRALARLIPLLTTGFLNTHRFSIFGLMCLLLSWNVSAREVTLDWDPAQDPNLAGYRLYYGYAKGSYEGVVDLDKRTTYTIPDLEENQAYYFVVVAYDVNGVESDLSQEVVYDGTTVDSEEDAGEDAAPFQAEAYQSEADRAPVLQETDELATNGLGTAPATAQDSQDDQDRDRSETRSDLHIIPQSELTIISVDSETLMGEGAAESAIDDRVETFWHTKRSAKASGHPHELVIALGAEYVVRGFRYLPRQDGKSDGMVEQYSLYVSEDGKNWGEAVTTGTFPRDIAVKEVTFPGKVGSFVRFVAHSEVDGKPWTSAAEIKVLRG
jgi:F5/8 type C domain/Fibronectin type III domain